MSPFDPLDPYASDPLTDPLEAPAQDAGAFDWADEAAKTEVTSALKSELQAAREARSEHMDKVYKWRHAYELRTPDRAGPWEGSANYMVPLTREKIDAVACTLTEGLDVEPFYAFRARTVQAETVRATLEEYLDQQMDGLDIRAHASLIVQESLVTGLGISKTGYEAVQSATGKLIKRPTLEVVMLEDFLVSPVTVSELEDAFLVGQRFHMPYWRLEELFELGTIQDCEPLKARDASTSPNQTTHAIQQHSMVSASNQHGSRTVELHECWWRWRGQMWRSWIHEESGLLLLHEPNPYEHGRAPYALHRWWPRPNYLYGSSAVELLEPTQQEMNAITNMRLDGIALSTNPITLTVAGSQAARWFKKNTIQPGANIEVDNLETPTISQFQLAPPSPASITDMQVLEGRAANVLIPSVGMGRPLVDRQQTATEVMRDQGFVEAKGKAFLHNLHSGFRDLGWLAYHLLYQYEVRPAGLMGKSFLSGDKERVVLPSDMWLEDIDLEVNGRETQTAKVERGQIAFQNMQVVGPYLTPGPTGVPLIDTDERIWELVNDYLRAHNVKNAAKLIGSREQMRQKLQQRQLQEAMAPMLAQAMVGQGGPQ